MNLPVKNYTVNSNEFILKILGRHALQLQEDIDFCGYSRIIIECRAPTIVQGILLITYTIRRTPHIIHQQRAYICA